MKKWYGAALVAIVAVILMTVTFTRMQVHAQATQRVEEVGQLQKALSLYSTTHAHFPVATERTQLSGTDPVSKALVRDGELSVSDAIDLGQDEFSYVTNPTGDTYHVQFCLASDVSNYSKGCENTVTP